MTETTTGGCQCGAVRYALTGALRGPHLCHCRMCQKAFGSFFAPLVGVPTEDFALTRGALAIFNSSDLTERGFCSNCGTPLTFRYVDGQHMSVSIGSLDEPEKAKPLDQHGVEGRLSWFAELAGLPDRPPTEQEDAVGAGKIRASNHQHPDHDTTGWNALPAQN